MDKINYAVFLDIVGTLTWGSSTTSEENAAVLRQAQAEGHLICINSGRSRGNIPKELLEQLSFDGIVAGGGAYVSLHDKILHREEIPPQWCLRFAAFFCRLGFAA